MDQRILIIGASGGIGSALVETYRSAGDDVVGLSRKYDGLEVTSEASVVENLGQLSGPFDRIIVATGALEIGPYTPEKTIKSIDPEAMLAQFKLNTIGPALILKHSLALLPRDRPSVFAALSARVGSIGDNRIGGWTSYRTAKAALNQVIRTAAIELTRTHKQSICVALHPGTVETKFTEKYVGRHPAVPAAKAAANLRHVIEGLGPNDSGQFFDWAGQPIPW
ncbi:MAG: NAD(P)-dependent dehydrogenase (short-subunit alcohol dehydrogenase family) [Paracoccaceae bacterium]|jgi:NAD(P)-dependent dehydrogenase (short-subunit alcohol dehydrogenase family)